MQPDSQSSIPSLRDGSLSKSGLFKQLASSNDPTQFGFCYLRTSKLEESQIYELEPNYDIIDKPETAKRLTPSFSDRLKAKKHLNPVVKNTLSIIKEESQTIRSSINGSKSVGTQSENVNGHNGNLRNDGGESNVSFERLACNRLKPVTAISINFAENTADGESDETKRKSKRNLSFENNQTANKKSKKEFESPNIILPDGSDSENNVGLRQMLHSAECLVSNSALKSIDINNDYMSPEKQLSGHSGAHEGLSIHSRSDKLMVPLDKSLQLDFAECTCCCFIFPLVNAIPHAEPAEDRADIFSNHVCSFQQLEYVLKMSQIVEKSDILVSKNQDRIASSFSLKCDQSYNEYKIKTVLSDKMEDKLNSVESPMKSLNSKTVKAPHVEKSKGESDSNQDHFSESLIDLKSSEEMPSLKIFTWTENDTQNLYKISESSNTNQQPRSFLKRKDLSKDNSINQVTNKFTKNSSPQNNYAFITSPRYEGKPQNFNMLMNRYRNMTPTHFQTERVNTNQNEGASIDSEDFGSIKVAHLQKKQLNNKNFGNTSNDFNTQAMLENDSSFFRDITDKNYNSAHGHHKTNVKKKMVSVIEQSLTPKFNEENNQLIRMHSEPYEVERHDTDPEEHVVNPSDTDFAKFSVPNSLKNIKEFGSMTNVKDLISNLNLLSNKNFDAMNTNSSGNNSPLNVDDLMRNGRFPIVAKRIEDSCSASIGTGKQTRSYCLPKESNVERIALSTSTNQNLPKESLSLQVRNFIGDSSKCINGNANYQGVQFFKHSFEFIKKVEKEDNPIFIDTFARPSIENRIQNQPINSFSEKSFHEVTQNQLIQEQQTNKLIALIQSQPQSGHQLNSSVGDHSQHSKSEISKLVDSSQQNTIENSERGIFHNSLMSSNGEKKNLIANPISNSKAADNDTNVFVSFVTRQSPRSQDLPFHNSFEVECNSPPDKNHQPVEAIEFSSPSFKSDNLSSQLVAVNASNSPVERSGALRNSAGQESFSFAFIPARRSIFSRNRSHDSSPKESIKEEEAGLSDEYDNRYLTENNSHVNDLHEASNIQQYQSLKNSTKKSKPTPSKKFIIAQNPEHSKPHVKLSAFNENVNPSKETRSQIFKAFIANKIFNDRDRGSTKNNACNSKQQGRFTVSDSRQISEIRNQKKVVMSSVEKQLIPLNNSDFDYHRGSLDSKFKKAHLKNQTPLGRLKILFASDAKEANSISNIFENKRKSQMTQRVKNIFTGNKVSSLNGSKKCSSPKIKQRQLNDNVDDLQTCLKEFFYALNKIKSFNNLDEIHGDLMLDFSEFVQIADRLHLTEIESVSEEEKILLHKLFDQVYKMDESNIAKSTDRSWSSIQNQKIIQIKNLTAFFLVVFNDFDPKLLERLDCEVSWKDQDDFDQLKVAYSIFRKNRANFLKSLSKPPDSKSRIDSYFGYSIPVSSKLPNSLGKYNKPTPANHFYSINNKSNLRGSGENKHDIIFSDKLNFKNSRINTEQGSLNKFASQISGYRNKKGLALNNSRSKPKFSSSLISQSPKQENLRSPLLKLNLNNL